MRSVPGAVATGLKFGDLEPSRRLSPGRIHHPKAACPLGDRGPLPVLTPSSPSGRVLDGTKICRLYFSIALLEAWFQAHPFAQPSCYLQDDNCVLRELY